MPTKLDLRKVLKYLYSPSAKKPEVVDVPEFNFLMLDGLIGDSMGCMHARILAYRE